MLNNIVTEIKVNYRQWWFIPAIVNAILFVALYFFGCASLVEKVQGPPDVSETPITVVSIPAQNVSICDNILESLESDILHEEGRLVIKSFFITKNIFDIPSVRMYKDMYNRSSCHKEYGLYKNAANGVIAKVLNEQCVKVIDADFDKEFAKTMIRVCDESPVLPDEYVDYCLVLMVCKALGHF